jgi:hypothetical protein
MGDGFGSYLRKAFGGIAVVVSVAVSAYLLAVLVVALSDQGQPTGALVPVTDANPVYPEWYRAPAFLTAVSVALNLYPIAAVCYGIGRLCGYLGWRRPDADARMPPEAPTEPAPDDTEDRHRPTAGPAGDHCILGADLAVRHISPPMAGLFGLTPREMIGRSAETFIAPRDASNFAALLLAAHRQSGQTLTTTLLVQQPDDRLVPLDVTCCVAMDTATAELGTLVLSFQALSERSRLDNQLAALWY